MRVRLYALSIHEVHIESKSLLPPIIERYTTLLPPSLLEKQCSNNFRVLSLSVIGGQCNIRVFLELDMTFGRELVVLHMKPSMSGKFWVHAMRLVWIFEQRTFYIGSLRVKLILACQEVLK